MCVYIYIYIYVNGFTEGSDYNFTNYKFRNNKTLSLCKNLQFKQWLLKLKGISEIVVGEMIVGSLCKSINIISCVYIYIYIHIHIYIYIYISRERYTYTHT